MSFTERAVRREGDKELPLGPKAQRTREAILAAAADRFGQQGYQRTTVADVAEAAGVSLGTVYQYFRDRSDIVAALCQRHLRSLAERQDDTVEGSILAFVRSYADAAAMAGVWEEVAMLEPDMAELRRELGRVFTAAAERNLTNLTDLDPHLAAVALTGMVDRYCYVTYVMDPPPGGPPPAEESARLLAELWARATRA